MLRYLYIATYPIILIIIIFYSNDYLSINYVDIFPTYC